MFMMCQRMGLPPISTMGLGRRVVSSERREPKPPARLITLTAGLPPIGSGGTRDWFAVGPEKRSVDVRRRRVCRSGLERQAAVRGQPDQPLTRLIGPVRPAVLQHHRAVTREVATPVIV